MIVLPGYQLGALVHDSANCSIYRALRTSDGAAVVLKIPRVDASAAPDVLGRLVREHALLATLVIPGVVRCLGLESHQGVPILVFADASLKTLRQMLDGKPMPLAALLDFALALTEILGRVHEAGVVHKDINPSNVLWDPETKAIELIDFGIATRLPRETQDFKSANLLEGTLAYLSPEQTGRMNRAIDYRTDFYALGMTLYELATGRPAFSAGDPMALVHCHIAKVPTAPSELNPDIPVVLSQIIAKLIAKMAEDRYQSARGLAVDLQRLKEQLQRAEPLGGFSPGERDVSPKFQLPQKLYGRQNEVDQLLASFERVASGTAAVVTVCGYSGIGKSALVSEVHKPIVARRGYFASGKFDQFKRDVAYDAVLHAFRHVGRDLLLESPERLTLWRTTLTKTLGLNACVLTSLLPEFELLLGKLPPPSLVSATEGQARFNTTFQSFLSAFAEMGHPLVVFLDDVQWADSGSLSLIQTLATSAESRNFLLICAYRDNEVHASHPLTMVLDAARKAKVVPLESIVVKPLAQADVAHLVADALHRSAEDVADLAKSLHKKTAGNPFFLTQLLVALEHKNLIRFEHATGVWQWNLKEIETVGTTDNVVDLMIGRIRTLPERTQRMLQVAACVGNRFDLAVIAITQQRTQDETAADLWAALEEGFILAIESEALAVGAEKGQRSRWYRFLHDRVQQAAYAMLSDAERAALRLGVARLMLQSADPADPGAAIHDVLGHFMAAADLLTDPAERDVVAALALDAGQRARTSLAYATAQKALSFGLGLLSKDAWERTYPLAFGMHMELAQTEFLSANGERAVELFGIAIAHARTLPDKASAYLTRTNLAEMAGRFEEAIGLGLEALGLFGIQLPLAPSDADTDRLIAELFDAMGGRSPADLMDLPPMTDPDHVALIQTYTGLVATSYFVSTNFYASVVLNALIHSVRHGQTPLLVFAACGAAWTLIDRGHDTFGYNLGKFGFELSEKLGIGPIQARAYFQFGDWTRHRANFHIRENHGYLKKAFLFCLESGDLSWGCYSAVHLVANDFVLGHPIAEARVEAARWLEYTLKVKSPEMHDACKTMDRAYMTLLGLTDGPATYDDADGFDEAQYEAFLLANRSQCVQAYHYHHRAIVHYIFGNTREAFETDAKTAKVIWALHGQLKIEEHLFYQALIHLAHCLSAPEAERAAILEKARRNEQRLCALAAKSPKNYAHKQLLVTAELARLDGKHAEAAELYDVAIAAALEDGWVNIAAIACECALKFHTGLRRTARARGYLLEALTHYAVWGATAKVRQLNETYHALLPAARAATATGTVAGAAHNVTGTAQGLDLASVTKAAQAISTEIHLDRLLQTLIRILIENAGAQRGFIVLQRNGQLLIEASGGHGDDAVAVLQSTELEQSSELSVGVVSYVARTKQPVVLENATVAPTFAADPYIARRATKSLMCLPIVNQSRLVGVIYLENNLAVGCFDVARLAAVQILLTQMAISIENATLYANLEDKVRERTHELHLRERAIQLILDSTGDGLLSVGLDGRLDADPSRAAREWFGDAAIGGEAHAYLAGGDTHFSNAFIVGLGQVADDIFPFAVSADQLPRRLERADRVYELSYKQVFEDGVFKRVLVVVRDDTAAAAARRAESEALEKQGIIGRLLSDREGVERFLSESAGLLRQLSSERDEVVAKRLLHTLKGNAAIFGFGSLASQCHALETRLAEDEGSQLRVEDVAALEQSFNARVESIRTFLETADSGALRVDAEELATVIEAAKARADYRELIDVLESWRWRRSAEYLKSIKEQTVRVAERLGKKVAVAANDNGLRIEHGTLDPFLGSLIHVIRNAVDHGLEDNDARIAAGKPGVGAVQVSTRLDASHLTIEIVDDGRGIDLEKLSEVAKKRGLQMRGPEDVVDVLFADGVSTRDEVTEMSGRGVGLSAVRAACEDVGGKVHVSSTRGKGTTFSFQFPASLARKRGALQRRSA